VRRRIACEELRRNQVRLLQGGAVVPLRMAADTCSRSQARWLFMSESIAAELNSA